MCMYLKMIRQEKKDEHFYWEVNRANFTGKMKNIMNKGLS